MAQVLVRGLDDQIVARLKALAKAQNVSLEQKLRDMAVREVRAADETFDALSDLARRQTRGSKLDSTALIREDRDR